jgi:hypothetical protein
MTAPTRSRSRAAAARATTPAPTGAPRTPRPRRQPAQPKRTSAAERAYARRAQRAEMSQRSRAGNGSSAQPERRLRWLPRLRGPRSRASFVLLMMGLLATGVAVTLWLSTQAIADTYRLDELHENNARLLERKEQLQQQVARQESASSLAERARELGMVPAVDPAWIVVEADGSIRVVGKPTQAKPAAPPPSPEAPVADDAAAQEQAQQDGAHQDGADRVAGAAGLQGESEYGDH